MINVLFVGDVNGKPGRQALKALLPLLKKEKEVDFVIANGENSAGGFGITKEKFLDLLSAGVDVVTTGNHVWDKKETLGFIDAEKNLLRPANFPPDAPGRGFGIYDFQKNNTNHKIGVVNLIGRIFMSPADCPFRRAESVISEISAATKNIIVDFHAEATSEKQALGFFLDGKASAVIGSHTHVQTADERVLEDRTAFITD
ncbi:MAG TPA: YmdB family metallophosphoesterase, partial [bacterium]|nr:YmdB family metallophosphoesterase [bacterium]